MAMENDSLPVPKVPEASGGILGFIRGNAVRYPLVAVLPSLVFLMTLFYVNLCLSLLALPLVVVVLFWLFKINALWHQIAVGAVALLIASFLLTAVNTAMVSESPMSTYSDDQVLTDGIVTPYRGALTMQYTFTITVTSDASVVNTYVVVSGLYVENPLNLSMNLVSHSADNHTRNYSATATVESPVNNFYFSTSTDGEWHNTYVIDGPVSSDSVALFGALAWTMLIQIFGYCFMQLVIMILFLRMSGKSKDTRKKMMEDYMKKKEAMKPSKAGAGDSTGESTTGTEETFICSECGSEVRASAKFCPNCGEPFDEDEEETADAGPEKKQ